MILLLKKYWLFVLAFLLLNFVVMTVAGIISQPYKVGDMVAPMVLVFQIVGLIASFFAALLTVLVLSQKTTLPEEQLFVVMFSAVVFSLAIIALNFFSVFSFDRAQWEQGYLDAVLVLPFEFSMEQFRTLTVFESVLQSVAVLVQNAGSAFFGLALARKIMEKKR